MTNWKREIEDALYFNDDQWSDIEQITLSDSELEEEFDEGFGGEEGKPFTAWTKDFVYFPWCYDGAEGVASVSRNPDGKPTPHIGG